VTYSGRLGRGLLERPAADQLAEVTSKRSHFSHCAAVEDGVVANKSAPDQFPLDEIDLLVGWRAGKDEYLFTKAVAIVREWLLDAEKKDRLSDVLKEILAEARTPAGNRPRD